MLIVFQSIIVYGLMVWVMTHFGKIAYKTQYPQGIGGVDITEALAKQNDLVIGVYIKTIDIKNV